MELVEDKHSSKFNVTKYKEGTIIINNNTFTQPIVFHDKKIAYFKITKPNLISINDMEKYLNSTDLILIGTGEFNIIPNEILIKEMCDRSKGLEFMNTISACKTHNLLISENRSFVTILYP